MSFFSNTLYEKCKQQNTNDALQIIKNKPDRNKISYIGKKGKTPLICACEHKLVDVAINLIANHGKDCNIGIITPDNTSAFSLACINKLDSVMKALLTHSPQDCHLNKFMMNAIHNNTNIPLTPFMYLYYSKQDDMGDYILNAYPEYCGLGELYKINGSYISVMSFLCDLDKRMVITNIINNHYALSELYINNEKMDTQYKILCEKVILYLISDKSKEYIEFIVCSQIVDKLDFDSKIKIFHKLCTKEWFEIAYAVLQSIMNTTLQNKDLIWVKELLMAAICNGTDEMVLMIFEWKKDHFKGIHECKFCSKKSILLNYTGCCFDAHREHNCKNYVKDTIKMANIYKMNTSISIILCTRGLLNSFKYYMDTFPNSFANSLESTHFISSDNMKCAETSILIECIKRSTSLTLDVINRYPMICWVYDITKCDMLSYIINSYNSELALILVQRYPYLCNLEIITLEGKTHLIEACEAKMEDVVIAILDYYKNPRYPDININVNYVPKNGECAMELVLKHNMNTAKCIIQSFHDHNLNVIKHELNYYKKTDKLAKLYYGTQKMIMDIKITELGNKETELIQREVGVADRETEMFQKESVLAQKENDIKTKENAIKMKENEIKNKEKDVENKKAELKKADSESKNKCCLICYEDNATTYISLNCYHIISLCETCYPGYLNGSNCSVCRKTLNLKKCFPV